MRDEDLERMAAESENDGTFSRRVRTMQDFRYDEKQEKFWDLTTGELLSSRSLDGAIPKWHWPTTQDEKGNMHIVPPSKVMTGVDTGLTVEGSTWWPGMPQLIHDVFIGERGLMRLKGAACFNSYMPPDRSGLRKGNPERWIQHVKRLYPDPVEHEHFFDFAAHAIQRPDEKVNHGVVLAGSPGIGKDTALLPIRKGVGEWNTAEIAPDTVMSQYNGHVRSVLLVINEVRPQDEDYKASNFYNVLKPLLASPPEMLPMTVKYANTIYIRNLCHVVLTTNDPLTMYIPQDDRRLFVMTSPLPDPATHPNIFPKDYFTEMYDWLGSGGQDYVIRWLMDRDISRFNPAAPPPMTTGKLAVMGSAIQVRRTPADDAFDEFIERVHKGKKPKVFFHRDLIQFVTEFAFDDSQKIVNALNAKNFHFKMAERGYDMMRNPDAVYWATKVFTTRVAFVDRNVKHEERIKLIREELAKRPLEMRRDNPQGN